jgi:uncharacterized zinc-type alcohol dehydrogenase-like protein
MVIIMSKIKTGTALKPFDKKCKFTIDNLDTLEPNDLLIDVHFCGICHTELKKLNANLKNSIYTYIPGHEIVGQVVYKGASVTKFQIGDIVGVGSMINSCMHCSTCINGLENHCESQLIKKNIFDEDAISIIVGEDFALHIPNNLSVSSIAPLLCTGISTYSQLCHWKTKSNNKIGIISKSSVGILPAKIANAMGFEVTIISTIEDIIIPQELNSIRIKYHRDLNHLFNHYFDYILITTPDIEPQLIKRFIKPNGSTCTPECLLSIRKSLNAMQFFMKRSSITAMSKSWVKQTQELLNFCNQQNIQPMVHILQLSDIKNDFISINNNHLNYHLVIDLRRMHDNTIS